tara:strand:+ start:34 stop:414 length:381 start_codon:yes stop_codon:yes gene_type:complete
MFSYSIKVKKVRNPKGKIVAFASLIIDDVLEVDGFKIINGSKGLFCSAPQHKGKDKEGNDTWFEDVRFVGDETVRDTVKQEIHTAIINEYQKSEGTQNRATAAQAHATANENSTEGESGNGRRPLW